MPICVPSSKVWRAIFNIRAIASSPASENCFQKATLLSPFIVWKAAEAAPSSRSRRRRTRSARRDGVGKSTLLQTIVGLQPARAGAISLDWKEITRRAPYDRVKAGIAYVPQGREAFPYLTVFEKLRVVAEASQRSDAGAIEEALERFPRLRKILDRPAGFLSGGEAQQLAIARALVTRRGCCCSTSPPRASSRRSSSRSRMRSPT